MEARQFQMIRARRDPEASLETRIIQTEKPVLLGCSSICRIQGGDISRSPHERYVLRDDVALEC